MYKPELFPGLKNIKPDHTRQTLTYPLFFYSFGLAPSTLPQTSKGYPMPFQLAYSGNFHIVVWIGAATLPEAKQLSEDVGKFHRECGPSPIHGICLLVDETELPTKDARSFMDQETNALLARLQTVHYVLAVKSGFRRASLQAVLAGVFLMRGVGGRILCHKDQDAFGQYIKTNPGLIRSTTPVLLMNAIEQAKRKAAPTKPL